MDLDGKVKVGEAERISQIGTHEYEIIQAHSHLISSTYGDSYQHPKVLFVKEAKSDDNPRHMPQLRQGGFVTALHSSTSPQTL